MTTIFQSSGIGQPISVYNPDAEAKIGRWCAAPLIPDRCDTCWDHKTLAHYSAEGYHEEKAPDGTIWRFGTCHRCKPRRKE